MRLVLTAVCALFIAPVSALAHHGFAAEYDPTKCETVQGTLTSVDWHNPHAYFHMDVEGADGKVTSHAFEVNSTMAMNRSGTSRRDFLDNIGKVISARACPVRPGGTPNRWGTITLQLSDGATRYVGQNVERRSGAQ